MAASVQLVGASGACAEGRLEAPTDAVHVQGAIGLRTGIQLNLISASTPDDDQKLTKLRNAAQEIRLLESWALPLRVTHPFYENGELKGDEQIGCSLGGYPAACPDSGQLCQTGLARGCRAAIQ